MGGNSSKFKVVPFTEESYFVGETNNKNDDLNGKGKFIDENNNLYIGNFKNGTYNGHGTMQYNIDDEFNSDSDSEFESYQPNKPLYYKGQWKDNCRHGKGLLEFCDGAKYQGDFYLNEIHGKGTYTFNDTSYYIGDFIGGEQNGYGKYYLGNQKLQYKGEWLGNTFHGQGTFYYENGNIKYIGKWNSGYCHEIGTLYHENGCKNYKAVFYFGKPIQIIKDYNHNQIIENNNDNIINQNNKNNTATIVPPTDNNTYSDPSSPATIKTNISPYSTNKDRPIISVQPPPIPSAPPIFGTSTINPLNITQSSKSPKINNNTNQNKNQKPNLKTKSNFINFFKKSKDTTIVEENPLTKINLKPKYTENNNKILKENLTNNKNLYPSTDPFKNNKNVFKNPLQNPSNEPYNYTKNIIPINSYQDIITNNPSLSNNKKNIQRNRKSFPPTLSNNYDI